MNHLNPGLISAYNSLTDKHLNGYFSSSRIRRHLQRAGLITRSGRIVPDKEYRHKLIQRAHQRHVRECLAQAIFHKVLEMERVHQIEIKRKLEEFARRERVHKIKVERSKRYEEDIIRILSPRPPTGARGIRKQHSGPEGEHSESSESPGSSRPNTAPGKMQRPVRLKPIHSNSTTASLRRSSPNRLLESSNENDQPFNCTMDKECRRRLTAVEASRGISPYCLPVINNFVTPVPPATKRKERGVKVTPGSMLRGRRLRPTTASSGADVNEDPPMLRSSVHQSRVCLNMVYFGKTVHLSHDLIDMRDEVKVFQQHCGGENLCVYKGLIREGDTFQFISRRHRGFPFSLTFFLNGLQVERLSSCCEFKHRKGSRLGGRHGHFGFSNVEGASPCYKCIIAMGLDKKPTPPPKRVKEGFTSPKDAPEMETERTGEDAASQSECETTQPQEMETPVKEETAAEEDKVRADYEEDFEADDEGPAENAAAKEKKSPSPSGETEKQVQERGASETEDDENDEDIKSRSGSSSSGSDGEESDAEATKDSGEDEQPKEVDQEEPAVPPDEKDEAKQEEAAAAEAESAVPKDIQNSVRDSTEIDVSDTSVPSRNENKQSDDTSGDKEIEEMVDESKQEVEPERAKSVQEKLAEAILKESQCSSEPELSDTSTEEEEESCKSPEQDNKDGETFTEQQQTLVEETIQEKGVGGESEVVQDQEEMSEPKEQEHETEQEPHENSNSTTDEKVQTDEEDEKAAPEEDRNTAENDKSDDTEDTGLHPVPDEEMAEDDKTSEPQEDVEVKSTDAEVTEKDKENEEKTAVEADTQPDETVQGAKSSEEDESSVSEPNKKPDETAAPDNAEAEAMTVSETMEMKAEPSEEREALNCEEAPVTDTEERQQGDSEDKVAASETEVTAENSSSSLEGSVDTTVEKTADTSEENAKDESNKDDNKETEVEEMSEAEASKNNIQQERYDVEEAQTETSVEKDDKLEDISEEESKEEEKQTNPDEITKDENSEERERDSEENNESKTEERIEEENISRWTKSDSNTDAKANEEQAEITHMEEDQVSNEEMADESEKPEKDEDSERVKNDNDEEESEEKGTTVDDTNEGEKISETNTAAEEERDSELEEEEKDQNENKAEQSEAAKNEEDEESEERKVETVEGEEISEIAQEPERSAGSDLDKDNVKVSDENIVESEDVGDGEAANVAHGTKTTEETLNTAMDAEDVKTETERGSDKEDVDAENGEISTGSENKTPEDEVEAQTEGKNEVKTAENEEDETKTEESTEDESTEVKEETVESGDGAEKHEDDKVDQASGTDVESEAKEGDDKMEKQDESIYDDLEPETSGMEIKEDSTSDDRKDSEETKQDENGSISDHDNIEESHVNAVIVAASGEQAQSSTTIDVDLDITGHKLDESTTPSDGKTDQHPHADENAAAADLSAADGEIGADTEEASKASEEGARVLLKPQVQSSQLTQNNVAEDTEESVAAGKQTPEALATEDNTDLVTNWITTHQTSKFFETFVEPLEDLKELTSDSQVSNSNEEVTQPAELPRSASQLKMANMSESAEQEPTSTDVNEPRDQTKEEAVESDLESNHAEDGKPCEDDPAKDTLQVEEETEVTDFIPKAESEQNDKESVNGQDVRPEDHEGSRVSAEDTVQEVLMQNNVEETDISKTEKESIAGSHHSVISGRAENVSENQTEEKSTDNGPDLNEKQAAIEEMKDLLPSSKTEEHHEESMSPEGLSKLKDTEQTWNQSQDVTEITDFTASKSEDGSQDESHHKEIQPKSSDASINGDKPDVQLIQDTTRSLSKDRLSIFSVDETLFGGSSYPLMTAAKTESGH